MRYRYLPLLGCILVCACTDSQHVRSEDQRNMHTLNHPNGVSVRYNSEKLSAKQEQSGFSFVDLMVPDRYRFTPGLEVSLDAGSEPSDSWPKLKMLGGRRVHYRIETSDDGGSGGREYELKAWVPCSADRYLSIQQHVQSHRDTPDFSAAWALLTGTTCPEH